MADGAFNEAIIHHSAGRLDAAAEAYQRTLAHEPQHTEANHLLGIILFQQGRAQVAVTHLASAAASMGATAEMHNNHGVVLRALGQSAEAAAAFMRALGKRANYAEAQNNLGAVYRDAGRITDAVHAFRAAVAAKPDYTEAQCNLRSAYGQVVPAWHFAMMNDTERNAAYEARLRQAAPGRHVLDIGAGAGLLAMMAARAGAARVSTCEKVDLIAEYAQQIVARNGLSGRITVHNRLSNDLKVGRDLTGRADVLVTETFSSGLLGEGILPTLEHAHAELLTDGAVVIPQTASARGYLIGGEMLRAKLFVGRAAGFDLAPFADFAPDKVGLCLDHEPHEVLSDDVELMRFTLTDRRFPVTAGKIQLTATRSGVCVGLAQWLKLDLGADIVYENRPSPRASGTTWAHIVYRFPVPTPVAPGDVVELAVGHDREQILVNVIAPRLDEVRA